VTTREAAELQVLLEGVPLPAGKQELLDYARAQDRNQLARLLERLPESEYGSLDEVGEALEPVQPVQPHRASADAREPRVESGEPPGGEAYTDPSAEPGSIRERGPRADAP
jgi:uncharacterized protein DUF2795